MSELKPLNYLENYSELSDKGIFRISPSSVYKFNYSKNTWFREQVLKEVDFESSTSTVLGTCVHRVAEAYIKLGKGKYKEFLLKELPEYINTFEDNSEIDVDYIHSQWQEMGEVLVDNIEVFGVPKYSEIAMKAELIKGVYVAGTIDAMSNSVIIDFKTTSKTTPYTQIPINYKIQLLTYVWLAKQNGFNIDYVSIYWVTNNIVGRISEKTGKPLKDYPAKVDVVTEMVTQEDMEFIEEYLKLVGETFIKFKEEPSLAYLLYSDYRLKNMDFTEVLKQYK